MLAAAAGDSIADRLGQAFRFGVPPTAVSTARLDAWVTPPAYTARPPIMLVDGSRASAPTPVGEVADHRSAGSQRAHRALERRTRIGDDA